MPNEKRFPDKSIFQLPARDERGGALIFVLLVAVTVALLGSFAIRMSGSESRISSNFERGLAARHFSEAALEQAVGLQNNLAASPRYLFKPSSYTYRALSASDTSRFVAGSAVAPITGNASSIGTIQVSVVGKDPVTQPPPYRLQATTTLNDGSRATYQAVVDVTSLLDFAVFSDADIYIAPNIEISGRLYSGDNIVLTAPVATFLQRVEYASSLFNASFGDFRKGYQNVPPLPSIPSLVDLTFFENASKQAGVCGDGRGLYIGFDGPSAVDQQTQNLFRAYRAGGGGPVGYKSSSQSGCRTSSSCMLIDLTLFDFSVSPITYAGTPLIGYDGSSLTDFNGVIWVDPELHIFGHLGGRSPEEGTVTDAQGYITPPMITANRYSNNVLDSGEDGSGGGVVNGKLDSANRGVNLGVYGNGRIYIDHNIFAGADTAGVPVRMALVARGHVKIDAKSPRVITIESAVLSVTGSWLPDGGSSNHRVNDWANNNGDQPPNTYVYDIDGDGVIETNNGMPRSSDRNETSMRSAWRLLNLGNLVVRQRPSSGIWAAANHPRFYKYDTKLQTAEIPCYPTLPNYGIVPGSFAEVMGAP